MAFDSTDHAAGVAGVAPFVAALLPWSVSFAGGNFSRSVAVRFVFGSVELGFGPRSGAMASTVVGVTGLSGRYGGDLARAATLWLLAAALLAVALALGVGLFVAGERLTRRFFDPVRLVGVLCLGMALSLSGATWLFYRHTPQVPIPVGVVALYLFAGGVLALDRTPRDAAATETAKPHD